MSSAHYIQLRLKLCAAFGRLFTDKYSDIISPRSGPNINYTT